MARGGEGVEHARIIAGEHSTPGRSAKEIGWQEIGWQPAGQPDNQIPCASKLARVLATRARRGGSRTGAQPAASLCHADGGLGAPDLFFILGGQFGISESDDNPLEIAGELEWNPVVLADWRAGVLADIEGFIDGYPDGNGSFDTALGDGLAIHA